MNWTLFWDLAFMAGAFVFLCLLAYGGWLCIPVEQEGLKGKRDVRARLAMRRAPVNERQNASLSALLLMAILALPYDADAADPFERGVKAYEESRYELAAREFRFAAERGDGRAQEVLGFMYLHGPSLFGTAIPYDRSQSVYWFGMAAKSGREVAQHMLCVLSGQPAGTIVARANCANKTVSASGAVLR